MQQLIDELKKHIEPGKGADLCKYFQVFPGGYGEGDKFWGIRVPALHKIAKKYRQLSLAKLTILITSEIHEQRMLALFILRLQFEKVAQDQQQILIDFYLQYIEGVNNWDLVDCSAHYLLGQWLLNKDLQPIWLLANSEQLWQQRIAVMSSFAFIRAGRFELTLQLAEQLLDHPHDLMHKVCGWMLREIGKRDLATEMQFLDKFYLQMPRTMLRYAIEKFPEPLRLDYLQGRR